MPISIVAFLKLRPRDLSAILEGSGWGVNSRMRLTRKQGRFFTERPKYPQGAKGIRRLGWRVILIVLLVLAAIAYGSYLLKQRGSGSELPAALTIQQDAGGEPLAPEAP